MKTKTRTVLSGEGGQESANITYAGGGESANIAYASPDLSCDY